MATYAIYKGYKSSRLIAGGFESKAEAEQILERLSHSYDELTVKKTRVLRIEVSVAEAWLTTDGEETEESGWDDTKNMIEKDLGRGWEGRTGEPDTRVIEWEADSGD